MNREITLTNGKIVKVYPVPPYIVDLALAKHKEPDVPTRPINKEVAIPGVNDGDLIPDPENAAYKEALRAYRIMVTEQWTNTRLLFGLKDEFPPNDFPDAATKEIWSYLGIVPVIPDDRLGRKLAWIKYDLLSSGSDLEMVLAAVESFASAPKEEIEMIMRTFRNTDKRDAGG